MTIADTVKTARVHQGLSIQALADKAGVDRPTLSRIESGQLDKTLAALGVELGAGGGDADTQLILWKELHVWHKNPRRDLGSTDSFADLIPSIKAQGVLLPLLVRPREGGYDVLAGKRRRGAVWYLCQSGQLPDDYKVRCVVRNISDRDAMRAALAENIAREGMNPMDEAEALLELANDGEPASDIADAIGRTVRFVNARIQLALELTDAAKVALRDEKITLAQAEALLAAEEKGDQGEALLAIGEGQLKTEADVRRFMTDKKWQRQAARERKAGLDFKGGEDALAIPKFLRREDGPALAPKPRQADIEELAPSPCRAKVEAAKAASKAAQQETKAKPHPDAPTEQELAIHKSVCKELVITGIGYEPMDEGGAPFMFDIWWPGTKRRITFYAAKAAPKAKRPRAGAGRRASRVKRRG